MSNNDTPEFLNVREGETDITLSRGLETSAGKINVLTMREPTVADQMASEAGKGGSGEKEIALFANLCMVTTADIQKLPLRDYVRLQAAFGLFLA